MNTAIFKIFGVLIFVFEVFVVQSLVSMRRFLFFDEKDSFRLMIALFAATAIGIGLLYSRRWATVYFSILTAPCALFFLMAPAAHMPLAAYIGSYSLALLLMTPTVATIQHWRDLSSGGKWYL